MKETIRLMVAVLGAVALVGEGALATLTLDGEPLEPTADGVYTFVGEKDTAVTITVASGDDESAVIRDFAGPGRLVFSFR